MTSRPKRRVQTEDNVHDNPPNLIDAVQKNDLEMARQAIEFDRESINRRGLHRETALQIAITQGSASMVQLLLAQPGIDITMKDDWGRDALELAIVVGHPIIKRDLFAYRARQLGLDGSSGGSGLYVVKP